MGQLGPNVADNTSVPTRIPLPGVDNRTATKIVGVSAGYAHTAVLTDTGTVLTFGRANNGQLGRGHVQDDDSVPAPVLGAENECRSGRV
jgi:alpha-tubulin suppressor-like RCC1 family protein